MANRLTFTGIPTELRVEIYRHFVHERATTEVVVSCCKAHLDRNHAKNFAACDGQLLQEYFRNFRLLLSINKFVQVEASAFLLRKWQLNFCIKHSTFMLRHFPTHLQDRLIGPFDRRWNLENPDDDYRLLNEPSILHLYAKYIPNIHLRIAFAPSDHNEHWAVKTTLWNTLLQVRFLVHALNNVNSQAKLSIDMRAVKREHHTKKDVQNAARTILSAFEPLQDQVDVAITLTVAEPTEEDQTFHSGADKRYRTYVEKLKAKKRSEYFPIHESRLEEAWFRLQDWVARISKCSYCGFDLQSSGDAKLIRRALTGAWRAQYKGDPAAFEKAKQSVIAAYRQWRKKCEDEAVGWLDKP